MMKTIVLIYIICSPISIAASLFIIITWGLFAKLKHQGSNMIFFQSISDFLFTLKYLVTVILYFGGIPQFDDQSFPVGNNNLDKHNNSVTCFILGAYGQFFGQATVMWCFMMTIKVFYSFFLKKPQFSTRGLSRKKHYQGDSIKYYHLFVWGFCTVNAVIIGAFQQYGPSSNGCWIVGDQNPFRLFELIPLYITLSISIIILIAILIKMRMREKQRQTSHNALYTQLSNEAYESQVYHQQEREFRMQLIKYIVIFVVFWVPPTILRTLEFFRYEEKFFILMDAASVSLQAAANSIVWVTSPQFFKLIKRKVKPSFSSPQKQQALESVYLINK
ncbi:hypothetical protein DLAC_11083 [Tieghemostelium lacteum]|uniref:G-protein-coupled receptor family protein n=1 Tax=Tieghemostelium lacteum TaxID=361077 RepID=A0A151Z362_TIELA|nr:hypothetical protein DLAC_11083 [Tieghemostelium lacteum]|eukprot:KYQ88385.1 hypothetical protein DLAC_11083 [Tieghemostelium lacteum]